jgi:hypothetical protein
LKHGAVASLLKSIVDTSPVFHESDQSAADTVAVITVDTSAGLPLASSGNGCSSTFASASF